MDAGKLHELDLFVQQERPQMYSVLVVRHGYLVFEKYYRGDASQTYDVASVTKSVTSALVGIALHDGYLSSLDQKVLDFFPELATPTLDPRTKTITIWHLLTMTGGFAWSEESTWQWPNGGDWAQYILNIQMAATPGEQFTYNTPAVHLLSGVLTKATGMSELAFADKYLFQPLGISTPQWLADPQGRNNGGRGLFLRPRAMAKLGYLYLNNGAWDGKQIIPAAWIKDSTQKESEGGFPEYEHYGYLWWITNVAGHPTYFAAGFGGQYIVVIPDLDIIAVTTSDPSQAHTENRDIIGKFIVPAVLN